MTELSIGDNFTAFIHQYLSSHLDKPFSPMHYEWLSLVGHRYLAVAAPRGFAKSHVFSFFYPLFRALEGKVDIIIASSTEQNAERFMSKIINEVENNELIKEDYGNQVGKVWRNNEIELANGSHIWCVGVEGKMRGKRPDILVLDDLENDENVLSEDWRNKVSSWFWKAALYTLKPYGQVIAIGTLVHPLALITILTTDTKIAEKGWEQRKYQGLVDGKSIWESQWPTAELIKRRELNPAAFEQEIQNNPIPDEWRKFKPEKFRYYQDLPKGLTFFTTVDPAFELSSTADYSVVLTCGIDIYGNRYVVEYDRKRLNPQELIDTIFKHLEKYNSLKLGIEETAFQRTIRYYFDLESKRRGRFVTVVPLNTEGKRKRYRIEALVPFINQGNIWFNKDNHKELLNELICYPTCRYDDIADALASQLDIMVKPSPEKEEMSPTCVKALCHKMWKIDSNKNKRRLFHA